MPFTLASIPSQIGKRILITGANSGIGYITARELVRHGAHVILACRDTTRGQAALTRLQQEAASPGAGSTELLQLDLASLASIRAVPNDQPLDTLINNAGVFAPPKRRTTQDGFELQFGTNVLGHFALTAHLFKSLTPQARIVTLASIAHKTGKITFDDLQSERSYAPQKAYQQSKLADLMFALQLNLKLQQANSQIESIAVHPGVAQSALFKIGSGKGLAAIAEKAISTTVGLLLNNDEQGALPTLFAATSPQAEAGGYYGPQGLLEMRGGDVGPAKIAPQALDQRAQQQLWQSCEDLTQCTLP